MVSLSSATKSHNGFGFSQILPIITQLCFLSSSVKHTSAQASYQRNQGTITYAIPTIQGIITGKIPMTADLDLHLCRYFRLSKGYFLRLKNAYELMAAKKTLGEKLNQIIPYSSLTTE
jgi:plasmid maintenance system antidote protein VapI